MRAERLDVACVATSRATEALARAERLRVLTLDEAGQLDLTVDGADEVDPALDLIKGGGGALLREKIVADASERMVVIADASKAVATLGRFPVAVEIVPFAPETTLRRITSSVGTLGLPGRAQIRKSDRGEEVTTDGGGLLLDLHLNCIPDAHALASRLAGVPGVVEHGLFLGLATLAVLAGPEGVRLVQRPRG